MLCSEFVGVEHANLLLYLVSTCFLRPLGGVSVVQSDRFAIFYVMRWSSVLGCRNEHVHLL